MALLELKTVYSIRPSSGTNSDGLWMFWMMLPEVRETSPCASKRMAGLLPTVAYSYGGARPEHTARDKASLRRDAD